MKTAIYIEQGITQLVLTPENDWERNVIDSISRDAQKVQIFEGGFYECLGGWVRQSTDPQSLIMRLDIKSEPRP